MRTVREQLDPQIKRSLSRAFRNAEEALLELVDNSIDERIAGEPLLVKMSAKPGEVMIFDSGGRGMDYERLKRFLNWGKSDKRDCLGRYGQGGKAAMLYLGSEWRLRCKSPGDRCYYIISDRDAHDYTKLKEYHVEEHPADEHVRDRGSVEIQIRKLEREPSPVRLVHRLKEAYRLVLERGALRLYVNDKPVEPEPWPVRERKAHFDHPVAGGRIAGWAGVLEPGGKLKGGIRCYAFGRLIEESYYFEHPQPTYRASMSLLIGQVMLDHVPLTTNKTGFDKGSPQWQEAQTVVYRELEPIVRELLARRDTREITKKEENSLREARRLFDAALEQLRKEQELREKLEALVGKFSGQSGRKKPEPRAEPSPRQTSRGGGGRSKEPRTPPPPGAVGALRRLGGMPPWKLKVLPRDRRAETDPATRRIYINVEFPLYKQRGGDTLYIVETATLESCRTPDEDRGIGEYLEDVNGILQQVCHVIDTQGAAVATQ
jgi:hypothetical protein